MAPGAEVGEIAGVGVGGGEVAQQGVVHARGVVVPVEAALAEPVVADVVPVVGLARVGDVAVVAVEDEGGAAGIQRRAAVGASLRVDQGHDGTLVIGEVPVLTTFVDVVKSYGCVYLQA